MSTSGLSSHGDPKPILSADLAWLEEGGELGKLISQYPWETTPLGPLRQWPQSLRTAVSLMLNSQQPMWIGWGPQITFLYNDAYISVLSRSKHPWALGRPAQEVWAEIWDVCGPLTEKVFQRGQASFLEDVQLFMKRGDFIEETYYSFSYSPIRDESGRVGGLFCPSAEVSSKVLNTRRLSTLSELSANALLEKTVSRACETAFATLRKNFPDIPFAALYLFDSTGKTLDRVEQIGLKSADENILPTAVNFSANEVRSLWPFAEVLGTGKLSPLPLPVSAALPDGAANQRIFSAVLLPVAARGNDRPFGFFAAGVNPARLLDQEYRTFYELIAGQIATAIQNARAAEEQLRQAEELAELDRAKTTFFSNVSHELRTPLTLMLGPLEELSNGHAAKNADHAAALAQVAHRNGLRLLKLVNTLLDFSRLEAGRLQGRFEALDLGAYTAELASTFRSAIEHAGLKFVIDAPAGFEAAYIDPNLWEKIVLNLLSNALKFTLQGEIAIHLRETNDSFVLDVKDTGIGISIEAQPRLFERFYRVEGARGRTQEGTGIGLALVQDLVKLHGGNIRAESAIGAGTRFTVTIPRGSHHLPADRLVREHRPAAPQISTQFTQEASRWHGVDDLVSVFSDLENREESAATPKIGRVLLVDDNADMRDYIARLLAEKFDVLTAADGEGAIEVLKHARPDLILSDVMMPRLDGFGLIRAVRAHPAWRTLPVILLSARAGDEARLEGVSEGADDYLVKPFSARELIARVSTHLELARVRQEAERKEREAREETQVLYQRVQNTADRLNFSLESLALGQWSWDVNSDLITCSPRMLDIYGFPDGPTSTREAIRVCIHPEDRQRAREASRRTIETASDYEIEYRVLHPTRGLRWVAVKGRPVFNHDRELTGMMGVTQDITERKQAELHLLKQKDVLEQIVVGTELTDILESLTRWIEDFADRKMVATVLLVDAEGNSLNFAAGHRCPAELRQRLNRIEIRPEGAIAAAVVRKQAGSSMQRPGDLHWKPFDQEAAQLGVKATWSSPILSSIDDVLGTISIFYFEPVEPTNHERDLIDVATRTASIAIERKRAEEALRESRARVERHAEELEITVAERTAKLRETIGELEAFSYSISHDMRAPLRSMHSYAELLINEFSSQLSEEGQLYLQRVSRNATRLEMLVRDVLAYSKVAKEEVQLTPVNLDHFVAPLLEQYQELQNGRADLQIKSPLPTVLGHEAYLSQIFTNLVNNAVKFARKDVPLVIEIASTIENGMAMLTVSDNGIGIAPEHFGRIFEIFGRVYPDKMYEGTGIGLSIVKKAVHRLGGIVGVESKLGQGSTFWFTLRLR